MGQSLLRHLQKELNPTFSKERLWKVYRFSLDPIQRREAALLLTSKSPYSLLRRSRLLKAQGWGNSYSAALALKLQASTAEKLGASTEANLLWKALLKRFPLSPLSPDSYYFLGRSRPKLRQELLKIYPGHPASLAAALELGKNAKNPFQGALHLSRWGARWPGAEEEIRIACNTSRENLFTHKELESLAFGMARLGDGKTSLKCLKGHSPSGSVALRIGKTLLEGDQKDQVRGTEFLIKLALKQESLNESIEAISLISRRSNLSQEMLNKLPAHVFERSVGYVARKAISYRRNKLKKVFAKWKDYPDFWRLQWQLAREALLANEWKKTVEILNFIPTSSLPEPFAARQLFWKGFSTFKLGKEAESRLIWEKLVRSHPNGYYTWRALTRLGLEHLPALHGSNSSRFTYKPIYWRPLSSYEDIVNQLWRLGFPTESWEVWRTLKTQPFSMQSVDFNEAMVEARLRMAVGDDWTALRKLRETSLITLERSCPKLQDLKDLQHPFRFTAEIQTASNKSKVIGELLLAIIKEESRFSPRVISSSGAVGLMQLIPSTAMEIEGSKLKSKLLFDPDKNILLGAKYLAKLFNYWSGNPFLVVSSYNAGPTIVETWTSRQLNVDPELWVERIPYPETRFYTKKVLGSLWNYLRLQNSFCQTQNRMVNK